MKNSALVAVCATALAGLTGAVEAAVIVSDDFSDGDDAGWTYVDPNNDFWNNGALGSEYTSFNVTDDKAYQIQAFRGTTNSQARAGAYRGEETYADFLIEVDLVAFDATVDQAVGIVARLRDVGSFATDGYYATDGYLLNYSPSPGRAEGAAFQIRRMTDVGFTVIGSVDLPSLSDDGPHRLVFSGTGDDFLGRLLNASGGELAAVTATDDTYLEAGYAGLLVANNTATASATFDNFQAVPEPASAAVLVLAATATLLRRRRR